LADGGGSYCKNGLEKIGSSLSRVIDLIPFGWSTLVNEKVREPFQVDDWVVYRSDRSLPVPSALFKVLKIIPGRISARFYCKLNDRALYTCTKSNVFMSKEGIVKACVFVVDDVKESPVYIYAGYYMHIPNSFYRDFLGTKAVTKSRPLLISTLKLFIKLS
jgi:hypothetical protein